MSVTCGERISHCVPCWSREIPLSDKPEEDLGGDWANIKVLKKNPDGTVCLTSDGKPKLYTYTVEKSTGDLYGFPGVDGIDKRASISAKAAMILLSSPFYAIGMIIANAAKILVEISSVFWRVIPQSVQDFKDKGFFEAVGNGILSVVWVIPKEICESAWRIVRSPFYAVGMMWASGYAIVKPLEGRKWICKVETAWHQGADYRTDFRYRVSDKACAGLSPMDFVHKMLSGKAHFLAFCMQKRGNLRDKVLGEDRYTLYEFQPKALTDEVDSLTDQTTYSVTYNNIAHSVTIAREAGCAFVLAHALKSTDFPNDDCRDAFFNGLKEKIGDDLLLLDTGNRRDIELFDLVGLLDGEASQRTFEKGSALRPSNQPLAARIERCGLEIRLEKAYAQGAEAEDLVKAIMDVSLSQAREAKLTRSSLPSCSLPPLTDNQLAALKTPIDKLCNSNDGVEQIRGYKLRIAHLQQQLNTLKDEEQVLRCRLDLAECQMAIDMCERKKKVSPIPVSAARFELALYKDEENEAKTALQAIKEKIIAEMNALNIETVEADAKSNASDQKLFACLSKKFREKFSS